MGLEGRNRFVRGATLFTIITGLLEVAIGIYGALCLSTSQPQAYYAGPVVVGALFVIAGYRCW